MSLNGTNVIIADATGDIVGQGDFTITVGGEPIDISNKSDNDWVTRLEGELAGREVVMSGTLVYKNDVSYERVKARAFTGASDTYTATYGATGEALSGTFIAHGLSDATPLGGRVETSITLSSTGEVTRTPQTVS